MRVLLLSIMAFLYVMPAFAGDGTSAFRTTPYPLPRFVSLGSDEVAVRTGPGFKYPVLWIFKQSGLPVEIILEYDNWRKIRDHEGQSGWVHQSLLSGKRKGLVKNDGQTPVFKKPEEGSAVSAYLEKFVLTDIKSCEARHCEVRGEGYKGWIEKTSLFGVYEAEKFD